MSASEVTLQIDDQVVRVASQSFLAGEWRAHVSKQEAVPVDFIDSLPVNSFEFQLAELKARILHQMRADEASGSVHYGSLELFLKPGHVKAGKRFEKAELILFPSTHRIDFRKPGSGSAGAIVAGLVDIKRCTYEVCLTSCIAQSPNQVLHPFWVMKTSANQAECNLELMPKNHSTRRLKMNTDVAWQTPYARNTKVINAGDSLVLFRLKKTSTWLAKTKEVEDRLFVRIDKWDRHFIQFVTGQPLELRKEKDPHHLSIPAFQNLLDLRKSACDKLYNKHLRDAAAVAGDAEPPHRSAREEDLYLAGRVVDMACPDVQLEEEFMPGQIVSALWSVRDPVLWVELLPENLDYIALYMKKGLADHVETNQQPRRRKKLRGDADAGRMVHVSPKKKNRRGRKRKATHMEEEEQEVIQEEKPEAIQEEARPSRSSARDSDSDEDPVAALLRS
ncbi:unnamed protein product [Symbiodinium sp. KB8]|nr:unnamed protein product [Symbiodinium sp. KB8]